MYVCFFVYHSNDKLYKEFLSTVLLARAKDDYTDEFPALNGLIAYN